MHDVTNVLNYFILISLDIDECSADSSPCDENADCSNFEGSHSCACKTGFTGDGKTCQGIFIANIRYVCGGIGINCKAARSTLVNHSKEVREDSTEVNYFSSYGDFDKSGVHGWT